MPKPNSLKLRRWRKHRISSGVDVNVSAAVNRLTVIVATLVNPLLGHEVVPLPAIEEHYSTAGEVAAQLGCTANKIGRVANKHNLKTEQYGKFFLDKSRHSDKQVEAFRYNAEGVQALRHLIHGADVA